MKYFITLPLLLFSFLVCLAGESGGIIRGIITTADGQPAAGVTIMVKGKGRGAVTDEHGRFVIANLPTGTYELEISLIGYAREYQTVQVDEKSVHDLALQLKLTRQELDEVVIRTGLRSYTAKSPSVSLRLNEPILEIPQQVQVVTGKALADQQVISMSDGVLRNVSGAVRLEHWGDLYTNVSSRGSQVQAFRNGFNVVNSYWGPLTEDMSFVDHIEFVKGPAGFMLSNGDPSGLYNVVTKKPTGQTRGEMGITLGSFDLYRASLDLDGLINKSGTLLYRLNLAGQQKKTHRDFEFNNRYVVAPVISYRPDDKTTMTFEYNLQTAKMSDVGSYYIFSPEGYATLPAGFTTMPAGMPATKIKDHSGYVTLRRELNNTWTFTGQLAYFNYNQEGTSMWPSVIHPDGTMIRAVSSWQAASEMTMGQFFVNGNWKTGKVDHRLLAGVDVANKVYYADWGQYHELDTTGAEFDPQNPYYGTPVNGYPDFDYSTPIKERALAIGGTMDQRYSGLYMQDELRFMNNKIRLTLAGRYAYVKQSEWGDPAKSARRFTPRIGVSVSLNKETSVYALFDQSFIPQGGKLANGNKVQPITGSNLEVGLKKDWSGGQWSSTLSLYRILKEHELTADPNSPPAAGLSIELGQKRAEGIEFDLRGKIARGLNLVVNYAFTDSKITRLSDGVTGMKVGDNVPGYVKHTANTWLQYSIPGGPLRGTGFSLGATYLSGRYTWWDPSPDPSQVLPDYVKLDGGIHWEKDQITLTANIFNILNKYLYSGSFYAWLNAYYWQTDPPRNIRFSVQYHF